MRCITINYTLILWALPLNSSSHAKLPHLQLFFCSLFWVELLFNLCVGLLWCILKTDYDVLNPLFINQNSKNLGLECAKPKCSQPQNVITQTLRAATTYWSIDLFINTTHSLNISLWECLYIDIVARTFFPIVVSLIPLCTLSRNSDMINDLPLEWAQTRELNSHFEHFSTGRLITFLLIIDLASCIAGSYSL